MLKMYGQVEQVEQVEQAEHVEQKALVEVGCVG